MWVVNTIDNLDILDANKITCDALKTERGKRKGEGKGATCAQRN